MTSRWRDRHHPLAITSAAATYDAVLAHMAAVGQYHPAPPQGDDNPADWAGRPARLARFVCPCGARFHVRRHLEPHTITAQRHGVSPTTVSYIRSGRLWGWLTRPDRAAS